MRYSQVDTELIIWVCCASGNVTTSPIPIVLIVGEDLWWSHVVLDESIIKVVHDSHLNLRENEPADIVNLFLKILLPLSIHVQCHINIFFDSVNLSTHTWSGRGGCKECKEWGLVATQSCSASTHSTLWPKIWTSRLEIPLLAKFANQVTSFKAQLVR